MYVRIHNICLFISSYHSWGENLPMLRACVQRVECLGLLRYWCEGGDNCTPSNLIGYPAMDLCSHKTCDSMWQTNQQCCTLLSSEVSNISNTNRNYRTTNKQNKKRTLVGSNIRSHWWRDKQTTGHTGHTQTLIIFISHQSLIITMTYKQQLGSRRSVIKSPLVNI